jgi:hypothetical protein
MNQLQLLANCDDSFRSRSYVARLPWLGQDFVSVPRYPDSS